MKWTTGEETWELLQVIIKDNLVTLTQYEEKHNLLKVIQPVTQFETLSQEEEVHHKCDH